MKVRSFLVMGLTVSLPSVTAFAPAHLHRRAGSVDAVRLQAMFHGPRLDVTENNTRRFAVNGVRHAAGTLRRFNKQFRSTFQRLVQFSRKRLAVVALIMVMTLTQLTMAAAAVSGGRMGGSFGPSSRPSSPSRSSRSRSYQYRYSRPPPMYHFGSRPPIYFHRQQQTSLLGGTTVYTEPSRSVSPADLIILTGTGYLVLQGFRNNYRNNDTGGGATVGSMTVALQIPDRSDPNSILNRLERLAASSDTTTRRGLQRLMSQTALDLLRQETSFVSAASDSNYHSAAQAQRAFQSLSVRNRSKFERETVNKFNTEDEPDRPAARVDPGNNGRRPTYAVVTLTFALPGKSVNLPAVRDRQRVREALSSISIDTKLNEDGFFAGEVLWAPSEPDQVLTREDLYADYPNLIPL